MSEKLKLKPGFDAIYPEDIIHDFKILKLSSVAFQLKWLFISLRNPETDIFDLSDVKIRELTGLHRDTIRKARIELIKKSQIKHISYHIYFIPKESRSSTCPEIRQLVAQEIGNHLPKTQATSCLETGHQLPRNWAPVAQNVGNSIYNTNTNTNITNRDFKFLGNEKPIFNETEIPDLKRLYPFPEREKLKRHLSNRNYNESEIAKIFEKVYSLEYTGKA